MAECRIKHTAFAVEFFPHYGHGHTFDPIGVSTVECGGGQNLVHRVYMHVVLLRGIGERRDAFHDGVIRPRYIHAIVDDIAGVGDPLAARHELIFSLIAERIAHQPVHSGQTYTAPHRSAEIFYFWRFNRAHGDHGHDERKIAYRQIGKCLRTRRNMHGKTVAFQKFFRDSGRAFWRVALPATPTNKGLLLRH